jgi:creatinine amidohydrolase
MSVLMRELSWQQIEPLANDQSVVILPTAAVEQHGRHLPIEVDCCLVEAAATRAANRVQGQIPVLVAPTVSFGVSGYHMGFPGSMTLTMETFITVVQELATSLIHHGFRRILVLNGHGGNNDPIKIAARNVADRTGVAIATASYWNVAADGLAQFQDSEVDAIPGHACGFETACMLALRPELVDVEAMHSTPRGFGRPDYFKKRLQWREAKVQLPQQAGVVKEHGWDGDPTRGTRENGEKYLQIIEESLADFLVTFAQHDLFDAPFAYRPESVKATS